MCHKNAGVNLDFLKITNTRPKADKYQVTYLILIYRRESTDIRFYSNFWMINRLSRYFFAHMHLPLPLQLTLARLLFDPPPSPHTHIQKCLLLKSSHTSSLNALHYWCDIKSGLVFSLSFQSLKYWNHDSFTLGLNFGFGGLSQTGHSTPGCSPIGMHGVQHFLSIKLVAVLYSLSLLKAFAREIRSGSMRSQWRFGQVVLWSSIEVFEPNWNLIWWDTHSKYSAVLLRIQSV